MRTKLLLFILCTLIISCTQENITIINEDASSYTISENEGKALVKSFYNSAIQTKGAVEELFIEGDNANNWTVSTEDFELKKGKLKSEKVQIYKYKIRSGNQNGYAVVAGDSRIKKPLIYVEQGDINDTIDILPLKSYIRSIPVFIANELATYYKLEDSTEDIVTKVSTDPTYYSRCMLNTAWRQSSPFNLSAPSAPSSCGFDATYGGRYPAGCVPIAIVQIMSHHNKPTSLDWNSIRNSVTSNPPNLNSPSIISLNTLLAEIRLKLEAVYSCDGTGVYNYNNPLIPTVFSYYGFQCSSYQDYSFLAVKNSLYNDWPVYMRGSSNEGGHGWVCDGWTNYGNTSGDNYFHMNWGWGGNSNGFYYVPTNTTSPVFATARGYRFYYGFGIVTNIH